MKRILMIVIAYAMVISLLVSCSKNTVDKVPDIEQVKSICELATLECYYNNVAKMTVEAGKGITHWGEKDRELWIEYEGFAKVGVELSKVSIKIDENKVKIFMPKSKVLETGVFEINSDSYYISEDGWFNKNKIDTEKQQEAVEKAQSKMEKSIKNNSVLFEQADKKAKSLIENYIKEIGKISNIEYEIEWITNK